jgi:hypothetical protein
MADAANEYTAVIDTIILIHLVIWCWLDRHNIYF